MGDVLFSSWRAAGFLGHIALLFTSVLREMTANDCKFIEVLNCLLVVLIMRKIHNYTGS